MKEKELPQYIGHLTQVEYADWDTGAEYILYGITQEADIPADDVDRVEAEDWDGSVVWHNDLRPYFLVETGGDVVLTDEEPDGLEYELDVERQEVRVAIKEEGVREYIEIEDTWYGPHYSAGELYMYWRAYTKKNGDNLPRENRPSSDVDVYEVSLLDPFGGGGTFYAECQNKLGSGDMPEEAMAEVVWEVRR